MWVQQLLQYRVALVSIVRHVKQAADNKACQKVRIYSKKPSPASPINRMLENVITVNSVRQSGQLIVTVCAIVANMWLVLSF